jgi:hypothetical protein
VSVCRLICNHHGYHVLARLSVVLEVDEPWRYKALHADLDLLRIPTVSCDGGTSVSGVSWCVPNDVDIGFG